MRELRGGAAGTFFDLVELDAASNNGVEAMRDLIQSVHLGLGATSRRKVYIVDEVHMLSTAASNTLLKTLEEPPAHVVFVLATTDPQKVLPTIRSRTQHFEFTLLSHDELVGHLADILAREGVETDARGARSHRPPRGRLGPRRAVAARPGARGRRRPARRGAGAGGVRRRRRSSSGSRCSKRPRREDVAGVLVGRARDDGRRATTSRRVADDLLRTLRDAFLLRERRRARARTTARAEECERLAALAKEMGNAAVVRGDRDLGQAIVDIRGQAIADPRLVLEVAVVRIARRESRTREETLLDRVERLEQQIGGGGAPVAGAAGRGRAPTAPRPRRPRPAPAPEPGGPMLAARRRAQAAREAAAPAPAVEAPHRGRAARAGAEARRRRPRRGVRARRRDRGVAGRARRC